MLRGQEAEIFDGLVFSGDFLLSIYTFKRGVSTKVKIKGNEQIFNILKILIFHFSSGSFDEITIDDENGSNIYKVYGVDNFIFSNYFKINTSASNDVDICPYRQIADFIKKVVIGKNLKVTDVEFFSIYVRYEEPPPSIYSIIMGNKKFLK